MNEAIIYVFALVWAVVATVGAVWIMLSSRNARLRLEARYKDSHAQLQLDVNQLRKEVDRTSGAKLAAEVDALRGALDVMRASTRKELGTLWGRLGGKPRQGTFIDAATGLPLDEDDEVAAMVALQSAKPVGPGNGNGGT